MRTRIWRPTPGAHGDGGSVGASGMPSGIAWTAVIFMLEIPQAVLGPALAYARLVLAVRTHGRREALPTPLRAALELPRPRAVEEHAVPEPGAQARHVPVLHGRGRIDGRAEDPGEDDQAAFARIQAMGERPVDLLVRRGVDVVVHHDHVLVAVLRGAVAPQRGGDLLGLALVGLADLHHDVHAVGDGVYVDVAHAGDAGDLEDVPGDPRALHAGHHAVLTVGAGQRALETAAEDRLAPVRDARHLDGRPRRRDVGE